MDNTQYVNTYIDILTNTMTDAVMRNVSLQTNVKISEGIIESLQKTFEEIQTAGLTEIAELKTIHEGEITNLENLIKDQEERIKVLNSLLNDNEQLRIEYESTKHQVQHVETFRNELAREREQSSRMSASYEARIKELEDRISYLELPPSKRKKLEQEAVIKNPDETQSGDTEDGGTF